MNLKPDTFKVWEPKIIGIVLSFPAEWSTEMGTPLCRSKVSCAPFFAWEDERRRRRKRERLATKKDSNQLR